jgi:NAD-dependent aldehyde dehydrogenases
MIEQLFLQQKNHSLHLRKTNPRHRIDYLKTLEVLVEKNSKRFCEAIFADFKKPEFEVMATEILPLIKEIRFAQKNLLQWTKKQTVSTPMFLFGAKSYVQYEPLGVSLIIAPYNYPVYLALAPLAAALAAGNCAILKPSEFTPNTSRLLKELLTESFEKTHVSVVLGGAETSQELLRMPFDHVFFTGSTAVGKKIAEACAKHLVPVTLELGGKSPVIVDASADLDVAAEKIAWGKFVNGGQTCVAPDYAFVHEHVYGEFIELLGKKIAKFFGKTPEEIKSSAHFSRMIHPAHATRLSQNLKETIAQGAEVLIGGEIDEATAYVAPTVITKANWNSPLMQSEIFGPILPVIRYKELSQALHTINEHDKPLALYLFSHDSLDVERILTETSSGGVCINDVVVHLTNPNLPFGGVGASGYGKYHGFHGFKAFSNEKAVLHQRSPFKLHRLIQPPYDLAKIDFLKKLFR